MAGNGVQEGEARLGVELGPRARAPLGSRHHEQGLALNHERGRSQM